MQSRVDIDDGYELTLKDIQKKVGAMGVAAPSAAAFPWMLPQGVNLSDFESMAIPFSRENINKSVVEAFKDAENPGTSGDVVSASAQIEYLAIMERAARSRYMQPWTRSVLHAAGRFNGHGADTGPLIHSGLEYLRNVVKRSKS